MNKLTNENKSMNKLAIAASVAVASVAVSSAISSASTGDQGFRQLFGIFQAWLGGNLGKLLALIGFAGTFLVYMMTHKGSVLMIGIIISLIAGGMVGISGIFFKAGTKSFGSTY